ncbi:5-methylcytosine restriction system specificity protein McrC [Clostridium estertheticum]|uniref:5-methylcytosine restriction system specificity protein McrC n=1 Tax=Clostridium estertheticum TaxID=238834 RepID=UPI002714EB4F|nr:hypothetical protein [Clostridium estertheticum]
MTKDTLSCNYFNRLSKRYFAILEIINILYESQGIQLEGSSKHINLRGYFFDMNAFFETLIGRLLQNCSEGYSIKDQYSLHDMFIYTSGFNPCNRRSPTPRPDFAIMKEGRVVKLLDAKYRDLWERSLPAKMLYQLAIYAVNGIWDKTATILYPTLSDLPTTAKIDINDPVSCGNIASVILQPVNLEKVAELVPGDLGGVNGLCNGNYKLKEVLNDFEDIKHISIIAFTTRVELKVRLKTDVVYIINFPKTIKKYNIENITDLVKEDVNKKLISLNMIVKKLEKPM